MVDGWNKFLSVEENDMKYKVTYLLDGEEYKVYEIQAGEVVTPEPDPVLEGRTIITWSEIPWVMPAEDVTVTGTFTTLFFFSKVKKLVVFFVLIRLIATFAA